MSVKTSVDGVPEPYAMLATGQLFVNVQVSALGLQYSMALLIARTEVTVA
jgi:hypothetical protein